MNRDFRITAIFDGTNFAIWYKQLQVVLDANDMAFTLDDEEKWGEQRRAMDPAVLAVQVKKSYAIVFSSLTEKYQLEVSTLTKPWDVIEHIRATHARESPERAYFLYQSLLTKKMASDEKIDDHWAKMEQIRRQLASAGSEMNDNTFTAIILGSLPHEYEMVVLILLQQKGLDLKEMKSRLILT